MAVHSIRRLDTSMLLYLQPAGHDELVMDFRHHAYSWTTPLEEFPSDPGTVTVGTQQIGLTVPPPFPLPGDDLDSLLWLIGLHAFPDGVAGWLRPGDKFRLRRQPELEFLPHTPEQAAVVKALDRTLLATSERIAKSIGVEHNVAQQVINALSLMGALRRGAQTNAAPMEPPPPPSDEPLSPADRLRARLGLES